MCLNLRERKKNKNIFTMCREHCCFFFILMPFLFCILQQKIFSWSDFISCRWLSLRQSSEHIICFTSMHPIWFSIICVCYLRLDLLSWHVFLLKRHSGSLSLCARVLWFPCWFQWSCRIWRCSVNWHGCMWSWVSVHWALLRLPDRQAMGPNCPCRSVLWPSSLRSL